MTDIMGKEERLAKEDAALQQAEAQHAASFGTTQVAPQAQAPATQQPATTPETHASTTQESAVDWEKRYKDLQSHADKQKAATEKRLQTLEEQLRGAGMEPTSGKDAMTEVQEELEALKQFKHTVEVQEAVHKAQMAVSATHPDFEEIITDPIFEEWVKEQPEVFKKAIYDDVPDAGLAIKALTLFKAETGLMGASQVSKDHSKEQKELAAQVINDGRRREQPASQQKKIWTQAEINALSPSQYDTLEAEIDAAFAEGRIRF